MDGFNEKKWFLYIGDHHEGPFSLAEIQEKMSQGQATTSSYVWTEGMSDWKMMSEVTAFESLVKGDAAPASAPAAGPAAIQLENSENETPPVATPVSVEDAPAIVPEEPKLTEAAGAEPDTAVVTSIEPAKSAPAAPAVPIPTVALSTAPSEVKEQKQGHPARLIVLVLFLLALASGFGAMMMGYLDPVLNSPAIKAGLGTVSDVARPTIIKAVEKLPSLGRIFSPIPRLDDVSEEDFEDLKAVAMTPISGNGPKAAVALSQADPLVPAFYVASNLPDGASFEIIVEGIPDTLLNHLSFSSRSNAVIQKRLGKSGPFRFADGNPAPKGEYEIYVMESETQPDRVKEVLAAAQPSGIRLPAEMPKGAKVVLKKRYFIGGKKDPMYTARLNEYHEKLKARAVAELTELKQFTSTIESQLQSSVSNFSKFRHGKGRVSKKQAQSWGQFHGKWTQLDGQLSQSFQKWTPEILKNDYFYGMIYEVLQQAGDAVRRVHGVHQSYFTGAVDKTSFDIQLGQEVSNAQTMLSTLKAKIDIAEKAPATPNGMPRREGL